jgi:hypothetical protein
MREARAKRDVRRSDFFRTKVMRRITKGACPWDIYSIAVADEMFDWQSEWPSTI